MDNLAKYQGAFIKVFNVSGKDLNENFTSENVEKWDSVTQMALVTALEDAFDIVMDGRDIFKLNSYQSGIEILKKYQIDF